MRSLIFVCFSVLVLVSCQEEGKKMPDTQVVALDSSAIANEEARVNELAAFYTGTMPCPDCDGIETILTLNADEQRTFTLEEQYQGKESKVVESAGTWTLANDVVSLNAQTGVRKYQITSEGLVSLNDDGSQRDQESAKKYLLKKVLGE